MTHPMRLVLVPILLWLLLPPGGSAHAQEPTRPGGPDGPRRPSTAPVPAEVMAGSAYASFNLVLSKPLAAGSRWGVFHQNTLVAGYDDSGDDDLAVQSLVTFAAARNLRLTAGAFYASFPGISPTVGLQYLSAGPRWLVLVSPRVNVESEPSYSVFSILRYSSGSGPGLRPYLSLQALNTFDANAHIKSYQWLRVGVDAGGTQVGVGLNLDEAGPDPAVDTSVGLFVRRELF